MQRAIGVGGAAIATAGFILIGIGKRRRTGMALVVAGVVIMRLTIP